MTETEARRVAAELGIRYDGIVETRRGPGLQFTDTAVTGATFYVTTPSEVKARLEEKRRLFKEKAAGETLSAKMLKALVGRTINDISYEEMNRIIRRIQRMPQRERDAPKRVADVLAEEIGEKKALTYVDKALAAGMITARDYEQMRAALIFPIPRAEVPAPTVARGAAELIETQRRVREDFKRLSGASQEALRKPLEALDKDVKRLRKAWGL